MIEAVDEAGYLRLDLDELAERLGATREDCESTLAVLQGFDPAGVLARDLTECLALQLKERDRLDPAMQLLLSRLDLVAKRDLAAKVVGSGERWITELGNAELRELFALPNAAVVGSALVSVIAEGNGAPDLIARVEEYVRWLRSTI